jgi:hypothetical protein
MEDKPEWLTLQPNLDPLMVIPNAIIKTIDSVLAFVVTILNIANIILNVVKVFLVGLLDPIRAIIEAIIEEVRAFIHDLKQLGYYLTGDWNLISIMPLRAPELLGGFAAYERRMLKRLLNRKDPGRPDFTSRSACIGLFAYLSTGDIVALIELINRIKAFFGAIGESNPAPFPAPTVPEAEFMDSLSLFRQPLASLAGPPSKVELTWSMPGTGNMFTAPPAGFLVHISTVPNGFGVRTFASQTDATAGSVGVPSYTPAVGIEKTTGSELRLFGGVSDLSSRSADFSDVEEDSPQAHKMLLALGQNTPMFPPSALLVPGGTPLGGATFFTKVSGFSKAFPGQSYSATFDYDDLPQSISVEADADGKVTVTGENCYTFYARARPVTTAYAEALGDVKNGTPKAPALVGDETLKLSNWSYEQIEAKKTKALFKPQPGPPGPKFTLSSGEIGPASAPAVFSMPSASAMDLVTATTVALEILLLVRIDLTEAVVPEDPDAGHGGANTYEPGMGTGLEQFTDLLSNLKIDNIPLFYVTADAKKWRRQVRKKCRAAAARMFLEAPSESICEALTDEVQTLLNFKWSDIHSKWPDHTILETMKNQKGSWGVAANPVGCGLPDNSRRLKKGESVGIGVAADLWLSREGIFPPKALPNGKILAMALTDWGYPGAFYTGTGWSDYCPVLFSAPTGTADDRYTLYIQFVRRLLMDYDGGSMLKAASVVLGVASAASSRSPTESEWITRRALNDGALAPVEQLLDEVERYLLAILDGLQGMIDKIIAYIEAIQARIFQIQALIAMIRALLNSLTMFDLPSFSGLLLVENGTDGITKGLLTAENKPSDSPLSYGGGALVMAGGLPAILFEILELILGAEPAAEESE